MLQDALNADSRERWRECSFCTYYQRPNLTSGEFQSIMPNEDKFAFEIFQQIIEHLYPHLIIVLSAKASDSIKKQAGNNLPNNIHFFNSEYPSKWTEEARQDFKNAVDEISASWANYYLKIWLE